MYDVHLGLIGKPVVDFLLMIIKRFLLGVMVQALRANINWKSPLLQGLGQFGQNFSHCALLDRPVNALQLCR